MRNFWLRANIDGRETIVRAGPVGKNGGMTIALYQRDRGQSTWVLDIDARAVETPDGTELRLVVSGEDGVIFTKETMR